MPHQEVDAEIAQKIKEKDCKQETKTRAMIQRKIQHFAVLSISFLILEINVD